MPDKKETIIFAAFAFTVVLIIALASLFPGNKITGAVPAGQPDFTVTTTQYYLPVITRDGCTFKPAEAVESKGDCRTEGACVLVEKEGGVCKEFILDYTGRTRPRTGPEDTGSVAWSGAKYPTAGRTIAVNDIKGTQCYIPYGQTVYIQILNKDGSSDEQNPYNGCYRAEDTGGDFHGKCRIDIFSGVGIQDAKKASVSVDMRKANVWITDCTPREGFPGAAEKSTEIPIKYYLKPTFKVHIDYNLFGSYEKLVAEAKTSLESIKSCFHSGNSPEVCAGYASSYFDSVSIAEEKSDGKKEYIIKFNKAMPFNGKYYQDSANYKFAIIIQDKFAPPLVGISSSFRNGNINLDLSSLAYDTQAYFVACYQDTKSTSNPSFSSSNIALSPGDCGVSKFEAGQTFTILVRAKDDAGNMNTGEERNKVSLAIP